MSNLIKVNLYSIQPTFQVPFLFLKVSQEVTLTGWNLCPSQCSPTEDIIVTNIFNRHFGSHLQSQVSVLFVDCINTLARELNGHSVRTCHHLFLVLLLDKM